MLTFMEAVTTDGREVRIERDEPEPTRESDRLIHLLEHRLYVDGLAVDATGLAYSHDDAGRMILHTSIGDLVLSK